MKKRKEPIKPQQVQPGDYYFNEAGLMVFTEQYHLRRGFCCGSGCKHCPYRDKVKWGHEVAQSLKEVTQGDFGKGNHGCKEKCGHKGDIQIDQVLRLRFGEIPFSAPPRLCVKPNRQTGMKDSRLANKI